MPIKQENKSRYPKNWKEITKKILARAQNKCEMCGVENNSYGYRSLEGNFYTWQYIENALEIHGDDLFNNVLSNCFKPDGNPTKAIKIVLTVAHMDHTPENCDESNLKALCQKCHNNYDKDHRKQTRRETRYKKQNKLF